MINPRDVTQPTFEPVTIAEAKDWLRIDEEDTDQDAMILLVIIAMRERAEALTGMIFPRRVLEYRLDAFPDGEIRLPGAPLVQVNSIVYTDSDGVTQSLQASPPAWLENAWRTPGVVAPPYGESWPATLDVGGAVAIQYTAGYAAPNDIPRSLKLWMQTMISTFYENREQIVAGTIVTAVPRNYAVGLLDGLRVNNGFS